MGCTKRSPSTEKREEAWREGEWGGRVGWSAGPGGRLLGGPRRGLPSARRAEPARGDGPCVWERGEGWVLQEVRTGRSTRPSVSPPILLSGWLGPDGLAPPPRAGGRGTASATALRSQGGACWRRRRGGFALRVPVLMLACSAGLAASCPPPELDARRQRTTRSLLDCPSPLTRSTPRRNLLAVAASQPILRDGAPLPLPPGRGVCVSGRGWSDCTWAWPGLRDQALRDSRSAHACQSGHSTLRVSLGSLATLADDTRRARCRGCASSQRRRETP